MLYNVPHTCKIQALQQDGIVQSASDKQTFGKKVNVNGIFFREIHSVYFERIIIYYIVILHHFFYILYQFLQKDFRYVNIIDIEEAKEGKDAYFKDV